MLGTSMVDKRNWTPNIHIFCPRVANELWWHAVPDGSWKTHGESFKLSQVQRRMIIPLNDNSNTFVIVPIRSEVLLTQKVVPHKSSLKKLFRSSSWSQKVMRNAEELRMYARGVEIWRVFHISRQEFSDEFRGWWIFVWTQKKAQSAVESVSSRCDNAQSFRGNLGAVWGQSRPLMRIFNNDWHDQMNDWPRIDFNSYRMLRLRCRPAHRCCAILDFETWRTQTWMSCSNWKWN